MKKFLSFVFLNLIIFSFSLVIAQGAEIELCAPTETEIAPTRDFYVVGTIDRDGKSAEEMPLNIRINIVDKNGVVIRSITSNVAPNGQTPSYYFLTDYEFGTVRNDVKGIEINNFPPPDILFDGTDRDSIRNAYDKVVVNENYFAAVIYGGASKDFDLKYEDKYEQALTDIVKGEYEIVVVAYDLYGEEVCRAKEKLTVSDDSERLISAIEDKEYIEESKLVYPKSVAGYWDINKYINVQGANFTYTIDKRLLDNAVIEFSECKSTSVLLNYFSLNNKELSAMLGAAVENSDVKPSFLYYDIGEKSVSFDFAGETLTKKGSIEKSKHSKFLKVNRVETVDSRIIDFDVNDGVVLAEDAVFYGVYSPINLKSVKVSDGYKISNDVFKIKMVITDKDGNVLSEKTEASYLIREDSAISYNFEFGVSLEITDKMREAEHLTINLYAVNAKGEELLSSSEIDVKIVEKSDFISEYSDTYWGKVFCDLLNEMGATASGEALDPDSHIKRGDFATMVNRLLGYNIPKDAEFSDLSKESVFYNDCVTAREAGYMTGDEKGNINAEALIKREEAMIILARISDAQTNDTEIVFKDSDLISFWAKDYVDALCATGIVSGFDGYINPQKNITVAEAAALIIKTIKWMNSDEEMLSVGVGNNFVAEDDSIILNEIEIKDIEFIDGFTEENIAEFFKKNNAAFNAISEYLKTEFENGVYIGKVGNGLEIRDYKMGNILYLSDDATKLITGMSAYFINFAIRYNPSNGENVFFAMGKSDNKKEFGVVNTVHTEISGRKLSPITENWYYYIQE